MRRLRYWEQVGLVVPSIKKRLSPHNTVRLYNFQDLLALLVVSELRTERDMSLQRIRRLVAHLRSRDYEAPLRELRFATVGREIYFQHRDGTWEGDLRPDQIIFEQTIRLEPLRSRIEAAARRPAQDSGQVVKRRGVHASAPVFAGTRIPGVDRAGLPAARVCGGGDPGGVPGPAAGRRGRGPAAADRGRVGALSPRSRR